MSQPPGRNATTAGPKRDPSRVGAVAAVSVVAVVVAVVAVVLAGSDQPDEPPSTASPGAALAPLDVDAGVVHVHGLGVDPEDGTLYAATHSGLFRIPASGAAQRVANRTQDTMGFAVIGPGAFIGSGHPDPREDDVRPPLLGLIESSDAGETWARRSLHGQADFHALAVAHGQTFGYDSTSRTFMVSRDRVSWEHRAQQAMNDFAVSPEDPDIVLAVDRGALLTSNDGGRRFQPVSEAPTLAFLSWSSDDGVFGVDVAGVLHVSRDAGRTWQRRGALSSQPVEPEALEVVSPPGGASSTIYAAARDVGILESIDGGRSFRIRYAEP